MKITYIITIFFMILLFAFTSCISPPTITDTPQFNPSTIITLDGTTPSKITSQSKQKPTMLSAFEAYDLAVTQVKTMYEDLYLDEIRSGDYLLEFTSLDEKVNSEGQANYWKVIFLQIKNKIYKQIEVNIEKGEVTLIDEHEPHNIDDPDSLLKSNQLDIYKCKISGSEAIQIADQNGGYGYSRFWLRLNLWTTGHLYWDVGYGPRTRDKGKQEGVRFYINAETGEIISKSIETYTIY